MNALRRELLVLLHSNEGKRQPVLRRSVRDDFLYATDAVSLISGEAAETLMMRLQKAGWTTVRERDWLLLEKPVREPPRDWFGGPWGPEARCCLSLLRRHPAKEDPGTAEAARRLIKAGEEGPEAMERCCRELHRDWAERLRNGEQLPAVHPGFFGGMLSADVSGS